MQRSENIMVEINRTSMVENIQTQEVYRYKGEHNESGERHGNGQAFLANGDVFEGEYCNGKRHGFGKYIYQKLNGKTRSACYIGFYSCNKKTGNGMFMYADGSKFEGNWKDDKRDGYGTYYYSNGDVYKGYWSKDRRHGQGTYIYASSGMIYEGSWSEGKRSGKGKLTFGKQSFIGEFCNDQIIGPGKYIFDDGKTQHSEYITVEITDTEMKGVDEKNQTLSNGNYRPTVLKWQTLRDGRSAFGQESDFDDYEIPNSS